MIHASLLPALLALLPQATAAPAPPVAAAAPASAAAVRYRVSIDREPPRWNVEMTIPRSDAKPFDVWLARWTPGAYHQADFSQFVDSFDALDAAGDRLPVEEDFDPIRWTVRPKSAGAVTVKYRAAIASDGPMDFTPLILDVEGNRIRSDFAYVTGASLFAFVEGELARPAEVAFTLPEGWKIATDLPRDEKGLFRAESWWRLEDTPFTMGSGLQEVAFEVDGVPHRVATLGCSRERAEKLAAQCERIVRAAVAAMGGMPYDRYVFHLGFLPEGGNGGLEHTFSTLILLPAGMQDAEAHHVIAHEFLHLWNAERIHAEALEEHDPTKLFDSSTIWMNEGATEYLAGVILVQAELWSAERFFGLMAQKDATVNSRMMRGMLTRRSLEEQSRAWARITGTNFLELLTATYERAPVVLFAVDLEIRRASKGARTLFDVLKHLMREYAAKGRGYGEDELPKIFRAATGVDVDPFLARFVRGTELPDLDAHLDAIGLRKRSDGGGLEPRGDAKPEQVALREQYFSIPSGK